MNRLKWDTTSDVERMVAHLAQVLPRPLLALVVCELVEAVPGPPDVVRVWLNRVRAWASGRGEAPSLGEVSALDALTDGTGPCDERRLAARVGCVVHQAATAREAVELVLTVLSSNCAPEPYHEAHAAASTLLAEWLRRLVCWVSVAQLRLARCEGGLRTEGYFAELREERLVSITPR